MNALQLPWLEIAIGLSVLGALMVAFLRDPVLAYRWSIFFTGTIFVATFLEWLAHTLSVVGEPGTRLYIHDRPVLTVDVLSAPLLPTVALLHFLMAVSTARTKMNRFAFDGMLIACGLRLAAFGCKSEWLLIVFLIAGLIPTYFELLTRQKPTRVFVIHMSLFLAFLIAGWSCVEAGQAAIGSVLILAGVLVRCGTIPVHAWVADLFENASLGNAILFATPLTGVYVAFRLVLPVAPGWILAFMGVVSLVTALYAAGLALVAREARRFFAYLFLSHASLVLVGLELVTPISLTGALALWFSIILSLGGLGLVLRALEARWGRLSLNAYLGLYDSSPALAICFLLTGLAAVGFPGTLGFISAELLIDGAVHANLAMGLGVVLASAMNGIAIVRVYFLLFNGTPRLSAVSMQITRRERFAVLVLALLILGGGLYPQPGIQSRYVAAEHVLEERAQALGPPEPDHSP